MSEWKRLMKGFKRYILIERNLSRNTWINYESYLNDFIRELLVKHPKDVTKAKLDEYIISKKDKSSSTLARIVVSLKAFYRYLRYEGEIGSNSFDNLEPPKIEVRLPTVLSIDECFQLLEAPNIKHYLGLRDRAILEVLYSSGLRVSELTNLKIGNLHLDNGSMLINGKGDKQRWVPLGREAMKHTNAYIHKVRVVLIPRFSKEKRLFLSSEGKALSRVTIYSLVRSYSKVAGIEKKISPHTLRHCFASHMVQNGADLRSVQMMMGHASITTTEIYAKLNVDNLRKEVEKLDYFKRGNKGVPKVSL